MAPARVSPRLLGELESGRGLIDEDAPASAPGGGEDRVQPAAATDPPPETTEPQVAVAAQVRGELRPALLLDGYAGQRELRWVTNLDRGVRTSSPPDHRARRERRPRCSSK